MLSPQRLRSKTCNKNINWLDWQARNGLCHIRVIFSIQVIGSFIGVYISDF